jgi:predicted DNA-binding transcriptional regulator AlpA
MQQPDARTLDRIISREEFCKIAGVSIATVYRMQWRGDGPKPFKITPKRVGYKMSDVVAWLDNLHPATSASAAVSAAAA